MKNLTSFTSSPWTGRILILAGILLSAFNLRTAVTSLTPILDVLGQEFAFGSTMMGALGMVPTACFAIFGILTPRISRKLYLLPTALLAMFLATLGTVLRAYAEETWQLFFASGLALAGMGMGNVVLPPLVKRYFPLKIGAMSMAYITFLQLGTMLPALLSVPLTQEYGWPLALGIWSLPAALAMSIWLAVLWQTRANDAENYQTQGAQPAGQLNLRRSPLAWGLTLMFGMTSLISYAAFTWLPLIMIEAGASAEYAGVLLAVFAGLGLVSAIVMPWAAERMSNPFTLVMICAAAYAIAFPGLLWAPMAAPLLWIVLFGIGPSTFPLALTLINLRTKTSAGSTALSGFAQGIGYFLSCLGPLFFGILKTLGGGWEWPFLFLSFCVLVMVMGAWQVCKPRYLEDSLTPQTA